MSALEVYVSLVLLAGIEEPFTVMQQSAEKPLDYFMYIAHLLDEISFFLRQINMT